MTVSSGIKKVPALGEQELELLFLIDLSTH
jgi:hypothetical protein